MKSFSHFFTSFICYKESYPKLLLSIVNTIATNILLTLEVPTTQNGQTSSYKPTNCLSVLDHSVGLTLKRVKGIMTCFN